MASASPAPLLPFCSQPQQLQWLLWLPLQPHRTLYLPPCPVLLLQLVSSPSWSQVSSGLCFCPWCLDSALTCLDRDKQEHSILPRCCRICCPWARGGVRTVWRGHTVMQPPCYNIWLAALPFRPVAPPSCWGLSCPSSSFPWELLVLLPQALSVWCPILAGCGWAGC